jgi:hypothetical protein
MPSQPANGQQYGPGITRISVTGFKSLANKTDVEIRPLTVLAGANSSGKSSLMQPLLLMKQTFDNERIPPGPFWLRGEQIGFDTVEQFLSCIQPDPGAAKRLTLGLEAENNRATLSFEKGPHSDFIVAETASSNLPEGRIWRLNRGLSSEEIAELYASVSERPGKEQGELFIFQDRCFLAVGTESFGAFHRPEVHLLRNRVQDMIHVSGLRGSVDREFYVHGFPLGTSFPGDFEEYVPSILDAWKDPSKFGNGLRDLYELSNALQLLELASGVETRKLNESKIEVLIPRTLHGDPKDLVNIADVGLAVSQILPVLVALILAHPKQLVHIEQPELHLHPRAQWKLAQLLADAANRGVQLVIETHSSLLLQGILTQVAQDKISNDKVILHWFERDQETGLSTVNTAKPDAAGRVGDWPEDFSDVELGASNDYLDAVELKLYAGAK